MTRALIVLQNDQDRDTACRWARGVPLGSRIEFKETKRSLPQNDLMWALLTEVAQQMEHGGRKYSADEWKAIFLHAFGREISFLPSLDLKTFLPIELSSSDLSKQEMTDFIEFILKEGTERGVVFRDIQNSPSGASSTASEPGNASPSQEVLPEPAGEPPHSASAGSSNSGPDMFGKFAYEGDDLKNLREFAEKGIKEIRRNKPDDPKTIQFIEMMFPGYASELVTADAVKVLNGIKRALELVIAGDRNVDRIEAWFETEFFQEA